MANQYEAGAAWTIQRLRAPGATYFSGATRAARSIPPPVALATGPTGQANAGAVGANEYWVLDTSLPAQDLCWVVVQAHPLLQSDGASGTPAQVYWYPQGNNSLATAVTPPAMGPGGNLSAHTTSSAGTYTVSIAPDAPLGQSIWMPLDPDNTTLGVATSLVVQASAGGIGAADFSANLSHCRMLGYPLPVWASGALWEPLADRGM